MSSLPTWLDEFRGPGHNQLTRTGAVIVLVSFNSRKILKSDIKAFRDGRLCLQLSPNVRVQ